LTLLSNSDSINKFANDGLTPFKKRGRPMNDKIVDLEICTDCHGRIKPGEKHVCPKEAFVPCHPGCPDSPPVKKG